MRAQKHDRAEPRPPRFGRTCIGCRRICSTHDLVRLVLVDGCPTVDRERRLPGRGASIHPSADCVRQAVKRGAFERAFRRAVAAVAAPGLSPRFIEDLTQQVQAAFVSRGATVGLEAGNRNHS
jgi:predicted RNA-binding protein YlxR (DUF448 family)